MLDYLLGAGSSKFYPKTGPGPIELLAGSEEAGFFGEVSSSELFTSQELASQVRLLSEGTPSVTFPTWLKFFHRGKVLFIAKDLKFGSFSWANLYSAGLIYGEDGEGVTNAGIGVNQLTLLKKGPYTFRLRTITGMMQDPIEHTAGTETEVYSSEWTDLIYGLVPGAILDYPTGTLGNYTNTDLAISSNSDLVRESDFGDGAYVRGYANGRISRIVKVDRHTGKGAYYRPVLELEMGDLPLLKPINTHYSILSVIPPLSVKITPTSEGGGSSLLSLNNISIQTHGSSPPFGMSVSVEGNVSVRDVLISNNLLKAPSSVRIIAQEPN